MLVSFRGLFHMKISSTLNSNKRQGSEEEEILGEAVVKVDEDIEVGGVYPGCMDATEELPNDLSFEDPKTRWWFQIFFVFTPICGRFLFWRSYFSNGLVQAPTRKRFYIGLNGWIGFWAFFSVEWNVAEPDSQTLANPFWDVWEYTLED